MSDLPMLVYLIFREVLLIVSGSRRDREYQRLPECTKLAHNSNEKVIDLIKDNLCFSLFKGKIRHNRGCERRCSVYLSKNHEIDTYKMFTQSPQQWIICL